jgi:hypothetical protein
MAEEFTLRMLTDARFEFVDLSGASFHQVRFRGARFRYVDLSDVTIKGAVLRDVEISAEVQRLVVNGVDVMPFVEAELDRLHPERVKLRPSDADGFREAWTIIEGLWDETVERARALPPELLHEHVDGEWSFIETLRHLVFATDSWVRRALLGDPTPWDPLDLPWDEMRDAPGVPRDRDARPTLDEVVALRADRMGTVRNFLRDLTDEQLGGTTEPVDAPGWPEPERYPVIQPLSIVINEEWWHRQFAERDLATLIARS